MENHGYNHLLKKQCLSVITRKSSELCLLMYIYIYSLFLPFTNNTVHIFIHTHTHTRSMFQGGKGNCGAFSLQDFAPLGSGIMLHLQFLRLMFVVFSILAIINIPTMLFSSAGTRVDPNDQDAIGFYRISIGNLGTPSLDIYEMMKHNANPMNTTTNITTYSKQLVSIDNIDVDIPIIPSSSTSTTNNERVTLKKSSVMIIISIIDLISGIILLCTWIIYKEYIRNETLKAKSSVTPSDYSVYVSGLPKDATKDVRFSLYK